MHNWQNHHHVELSLRKGIQHDPRVITGQIRDLIKTEFGDMSHYHARIEPRHRFDINELYVTKLGAHPPIALVREKDDEYDTSLISRHSIVTPTTEPTQLTF